MRKRFSYLKIYIFALLLILCFSFSYLTVKIVKFPDEIQIMDSEESHITVNLPAQIKIRPLENQEFMPVSGAFDDVVNENINKTYVSSDSHEIELSFFGIPMKKVKVDVIPETEVVPCGMTIGVNILADGLLVLGSGNVFCVDGSTKSPGEGILKSGDIILTADGVKLNKIDELTEIVSFADGKITFKIKRDSDVFETQITPVKDESNVNKLGLWVRDSTQGIGTLTYYNPETRAFGALGHGVLDVDTKKIIPVRRGEIMESNIVSVKKGKKGAPGELVGEIDRKKSLGEIKSNTVLGLYGYLNSSDELPAERMKIALQGDVHEGPAKMLSNVTGKETKCYDVYIESLNRYSADESKGMVVRITDPELLTRTNGIVQGMSGSPILQDGKVIGALTHVFVQNPAKGYGIFIENMIKQENNL